MQINVKETVVDKRCIEFIANHIAQYGDDPSTWSTWQAALKAAGPVQHADNIDYTAAFEAELTSIANDSKMCIPSIILQTWATRLNSVVKTYSSLQAPR